MNPFEITGPITRWMHLQLKRIGFKNIKTYAISNDEFRIMTKDGKNYVFECPTVDENYHFNKFLEHADHELSINQYHPAKKGSVDEVKVVNFSVECLTCQEVIVDFNKK
jgi:hypothetical protein